MRRLCFSLSAGYAALRLKHNLPLLFHDLARVRIGRKI